MSDLNKEAAKSFTTFTGTFGNSSQAAFKYTAASAQVADKIYFGRIPRYCVVTGVTLINAALGGSTTMDVGYETADIGGTVVADLDYWINDQSTASIARTSSTALPLADQAEELYVVGTVAGAAATGEVWVIVDYIYKSK